MALGSTNPDKRQALEAVVANLSLPWRITALDVDSGVAALPHDERQTWRGALQRAQAAQAAGPYAFGVGVESGFVRRLHHWSVLTACVACDAAGRLSYASGGEMPLPPGLTPVEAIRLAGGRPLIDWATRGAWSRRRACEAAIAMALARWLQPQRDGATLPGGG